MKVIVGGRYKEIKKPHVLSFSWKWEGQDEETLVTILFKKISGDKTEITLTHEGFMTSDSMQQHNKGWESTFNKLDMFLKAT